MLKINNAAQYFLYLCDYCGEGKLIVFVCLPRVPCLAPPQAVQSSAPFNLRSVEK